MHKRDQKIEGNKKLRETEKDIEALREERMENVKGSLKNVRKKIKKMYKKKNSENK